MRRGTRDPNRPRDAAGREVGGSQGSLALLCRPLLSSAWGGRVTPGEACSHGTAPPRSSLFPALAIGKAHPSVERKPGSAAPSPPPGPAAFPRERQRCSGPRIPNMGAHWALLPRLVGRGSSTPPTKAKPAPKAKAADGTRPPFESHLMVPGW